jgi:mono/diheme cytochrome c family protein
VTEIPEHLLKRSRERRAALGLGGSDTGADAEGAEAAPAAATPAKAAEATPAAAPPTGPAARKAAAAAAAPPPKPDSPVVTAYKRRAKIPMWAMAALSLMPIWIFMYVRSLTEPPEVAAGPMGVGAEVYGNCASCHAGDGGGTEAGGTGRPFWNGEVNATFPNIEDQIRFVYFGTTRYNADGIASYGDPNREGGPRAPGSLGEMPPQGEAAGGDLTDAEILGVVCHERYAFNGPDTSEDEVAAVEFENWCAEESPIFAAVESGTPLADLDSTEVLDAEGEPIKILDMSAPAEGASKSDS